MSHQIIGPYQASLQLLCHIHFGVSTTFGIEAERKGFTAMRVKLQSLPLKSRTFIAKPVVSTFSDN
jgi:hypothetical protein